MSMRLLSMNQLAEITGIDRRTVKKRVEGLKVHPGSGNGHYYDAQEALPRIYTPESTPDLSKRILEEQFRYEQERTEKMSLHNARIRGELVAVQDVIQTWTDIAAKVKTKVLGIASKMKQRHSDLTLEQYASLESISRETLEELANGTDTEV